MSGVISPKWLNKQLQKLAREKRVRKWALRNRRDLIVEPQGEPSSSHSCFRGHQETKSSSSSHSSSTDKNKQKGKNENKGESSEHQLSEEENTEVADKLDRLFCTPTYIVGSHTPPLEDLLNFAILQPSLELSTEELPFLSNDNDTVQSLKKVQQE